jgi:hypothetical protein
MSFEEWVVSNLDPADSPYIAAKKAWQAAEKLYRKVPPSDDVRSFCHVRPDQAPGTELPKSPTENKSSVDV